MNNNNLHSIVYLVTPETLVGVNPPRLKLGRSDKPHCERLKSYGKKSIWLDVFQSMGTVKLETLLKTEFSKNFKQIRNEYFEGNIVDMRVLFSRVCLKFIQENRSSISEQLHTLNTITQPVKESNEEIVARFMETYYMTDPNDCNRSPSEKRPIKLSDIIQHFQDKTEHPMTCKDIRVALSNIGYKSKQGKSYRRKVRNKNGKLISTVTKKSGIFGIMRRPMN